MTTITEIARAAGVPVESVLRVLNRDSVSNDDAARILEAIERYGYGRLQQTQEGANPRRVTGEVVEQGRQGGIDPADAIERAREQLLKAVSGVVGQLEPRPDRPAADRMAIMDALLHRLAHDVDGMKRELGGAKSERLEDLTLLVDLITTSWRVVDRRLGRIDRKLERLEGRPGPHRQD
jgi:hypothetical protein